MNSEAEQSQSSFAAATSVASQQSSHIGKESVLSNLDDEESKQMGSPSGDGLPQVEETKEMPRKRRKVITVHTSDDDEDSDVATDDSFQNTNLSLMPEDSDNTKLA